MATAPKLGAVPTLAEVVSDPGKAAALPKEAIAQFRGELARLDTILLTALLSGGRAHSLMPDGDRLLDVEAAAQKLGTSPDWLYRHASKLPFVLRIGKKQLRFSDAGIDRYIADRAGR